MDKTAEYTWLQTALKDAVEENNELLNDSCFGFIKKLRETLVSELETENDSAIHGNNNIPDEVLRKYVSITKEIRAFWFDNIDTHLLTIERLADQTVARRRAYERARNKTAAQSLTPTNIRSGVGTSGKAVIQKPAQDKTATLFADLAKLDPAEIAKVLIAIGKK